MTDNSIYRALKQVFNEIDRAVELADLENYEAEDLLKALATDGGSIEVVDDEFEVNHENVTDLVENTIDINHTFGVDGSTTRDLRFNNGLVLSASVANTGVSGKGKPDEITRGGSICVTAHFENANIDIESPEYQKGNLDFFQYPSRVRRNRKLPDWLTTISRTYAEATELEKIISQVDNPVFVDGPLYPAEIFTWILYDQMDKANGTPVEDWREMIQKILQKNINAIEMCVRDDIPIFGIQKTTTSTRILDAIKNKCPDLDGEIPWNNDAVLFNSALSSTGSHNMSYTSWYIEKEVSVGQHDKVTPLRDYDGIDLKYGDYEEYMRAFFYVKPPTQKTVFRVGVPALLLNSDVYTKEEIRYIALNAMAEQYKEPTAILNADRKARIPRKIRREFRGLITSEGQRTRNEQRGFDNFGDSQ